MRHYFLNQFIVSELKHLQAAVMLLFIWDDAMSKFLYSFNLWSKGLKKKTIFANIQIVVFKMLLKSNIFSHLI